MNLHVAKKPIGWVRKSDLYALITDCAPDGKSVRIGVDHPSCWVDTGDTPYDHLIPIYISDEDREKLIDGEYEEWYKKEVSDESEIQ